MPVRPIRRLAVMLDPRGDTAWSEGAAYVQIISRLNLELAKPADFDGLTSITVKHEYVRARRIAHRW
jgi:hypothetical protein